MPNSYSHHYLFCSENRPSIDKIFCCSDFSTIRLGLGIKKRAGLLKNTGEEKHLFCEESHSAVPGLPNNRRPPATAAVHPGPVVTRAMGRGQPHHNGGDALSACLCRADPAPQSTAAPRSRPQGQFLPLLPARWDPEAPPLCAQIIRANLSQACQRFGDPHHCPEHRKSCKSS